MSNPVAEILDTFFNKRPAPKRQPSALRVRLTLKQLKQIEQGHTLIFSATGIEIQVTKK